MKCLNMEISLFFLVVIRALAYELHIGMLKPLPWCRKDFILFFSCWLFTYFAKELLLSATSSFHKNEWRVRLWFQNTLGA